MTEMIEGPAAVDQVAAGDEELREYADACRAAAADFLERSTRFNPKAGAFPSVQTRLAEFLVHVHHRFEVEVVPAVTKGPYAQLAGRSSSDLLFSDVSQFKRAVETQAKASLQSVELRELVVRSVVEGGYGAFSGRTRIHADPHRLVYEHACEGCAGGGSVTCRKCRGRGKLDCSSCSGSGERRCTSCGGSGEESYQVEVPSDGGSTRSETRYRSCDSCGGRRRVRCSSCLGTGDHKCGDCRGSGKVPCRDCEATGWITETCTTHTYTRRGCYGTYPPDGPAFLGAAVEGIGFDALRDEADLELSEVVRLWTRDPEDGVEFRYSCAIPVCEMDLRVDGATSRWVFAGRRNRIHDAGGALERLLANDEAQLATLGQSSARLLPWFHRRAAPILRSFMESEVHQQLADHAAAGATTDQIFERTKRALSTEYLERVQASLQTIVAAIAAWTKIKFMVLALLLAPFAYLGVRLVLSPTVPLASAAGGARVPICTVTGVSGFAGAFATAAVVALFGALATRTLQERWFTKVGGQPLFRWAAAKGKLAGKWAVALAVLLGTMTTATWFQRSPPWVDQQGRLYGLVGVVEPAAVLPPATVAPKAGTSSKPIKRGRPTAQTTAP